MLVTASAKKGCSFGILITHEKEWGSQRNIPSNIIVINQYSTQFEIELDERNALEKKTAVGV